MLTSLTKFFGNKPENITESDSKIMFSQTNYPGKILWLTQNNTDCRSIVVSNFRENENQTSGITTYITRTLQNKPSTLPYIEHPDKSCICYFTLDTSCETIVNNVIMSPYKYYSHYCYKMNKVHFFNTVS